MLDTKHAVFRGRLVIVGFGSIGQGVLPLLLRHLEIEPAQITIITAEPRGREEAAEYGIAFDQTALTRDNYRTRLAAAIGRSMCRVPR
jgi:homospermidine synthase